MPQGEMLTREISTGCGTTAAETVGQGETADRHRGRQQPGRCGGSCCWTAPSSCRLGVSGTAHPGIGPAVRQARCGVPHVGPTAFGSRCEWRSPRSSTPIAEPRHLGAEIGAIAVLHTWGQTLQHHPHLHCIAPGGGLSSDGTRWVACRPGFFLPVRVLSRRFRELFLARLQAAVHRR